MSKERRNPLPILGILVLVIGFVIWDQVKDRDSSDEAGSLPTAAEVSPAPESSPPQADPAQTAPAEKKPEAKPHTSRSARSAM